MHSQPLTCTNPYNTCQLDESYSEFVQKDMGEQTVLSPGVGTGFVEMSYIKFKGPS